MVRCFREGKEVIRSSTNHSWFAIGKQIFSNLESVQGCFLLYTNGRVWNKEETDGRNG